MAVLIGIRFNLVLLKPGQHIRYFIIKKSIINITIIKKYICFLKFYFLFKKYIKNNKIIKEFFRIPIKTTYFFIDKFKKLI